MQARHRIPTIFNIYMLDVICCALGCVILLWQVSHQEAEDQTAAANKQSAAAKSSQAEALKQEANYVRARKQYEQRNFDAAEQWCRAGMQSGYKKRWPWEESADGLLKEIQVARSQAGPMPADLRGGTKTDGSYNSTATAGNTPPLRSSPLSHARAVRHSRSIVVVDALSTCAISSTDRSVKNRSSTT